MSGDSGGESNWCVERLIAPLPSVPPDALGQTVYDMMVADPSAPSFAVVQDKRPIGLLSRQDILIAFSQPLVRASYEGRTVARLMRSPYILDDIALPRRDAGCPRRPDTMLRCFAAPLAFGGGVIAPRGIMSGRRHADGGGRMVIRSL